MRPYVHRTRHTLALHFSIHEVQSFMRSDAPDALATLLARFGPAASGAGGAPAP